MSNIFLISDTHFGHAAAVVMFKRADGTPLRDFSSAEECDEFMAKQWNSTVSPNDKVYHLGDVVMPKNHRNLSILSRLNGTKVLIKGNHDTLSLSKYQAYFKDVRGSHLLDNLVLTHIPVHHGSLTRWRGNIHGHLHSNAVMGSDSKIEDPKYFCVSVERINFTPIEFELVNKRFKDHGL